MRVEKGLLKDLVQVNKTSSAHLVLYFSSRRSLENHSYFEKLKECYPRAVIAGCSADDVILDSACRQGPGVYMAITFKTSSVLGVSKEIENSEKSYQVGYALAQDLSQKKCLKGVFVLYDSIRTNGSELVRGLSDVLNTTKVILTGGGAADGDTFEKTLVGCNEPPQEHKVIGIGFYGDDLVVKWGRGGEWSGFGPHREITHSQGNTLYMLDQTPCLDLYKKYLGKASDQLPLSAFHFPLSIWPQDQGEASKVIRTVLGINDREKSMSFAASIPRNWNAQLMWAKFDDLIDGAKSAALQSSFDTPKSLSFIVSCIGRKIMMGQKTVEEVETVKHVLGKKNSAIGFYSYGEIAPHPHTRTPVLHNQSMTITTLTERVATRGGGS